MLINHLLLFFKLFFGARNTKQLNFDNLKRTIKENQRVRRGLNSFKQTEVHCTKNEDFHQGFLQ